MQATEKKIIYVTIDKVDDNPFQPRRSYDDKYINELADSIKIEAKGDDAGYGVLQAPPSRKMPDGRYQIAAGHCRKRGVLRAGGTKFPLDVQALTDEDMQRIAIIENAQRQDMTHSDTAAAYLDYATRQGYSRNGDTATNDTAIAATAKALGKSAKEIRAYLAFGTLIPILQSLFDKGKLSFSIAADLASLAYADRMKVVRMITVQGKKAHEAEAMIAALIKERERQAQQDALGMGGEQFALFDAPVVPPAARQAQAKYAADMQAVTTTLARYGDAEGRELGAAIPALSLDVERERIKIMIATLRRMDAALVTAQGQKDAAALVAR